MSRSTDKTDTRRNPGVELTILRACMDCGGKRSVVGGRGIGVRWRCAACLPPALKP